MKKHTGEFIFWLLWGGVFPFFFFFLYNSGSLKTLPALPVQKRCKYSDQVTLLPWQRITILAHNRYSQRWNNNMFWPIFTSKFPHILKKRTFVIKISCNYSMLLLSYPSHSVSYIDGSHTIGSFNPMTIPHPILTKLKFLEVEPSHPYFLVLSSDSSVQPCLRIRALGPSYSVF